MPEPVKPPKRLAGADLVLELPGSIAERWDIAIALAEDSSSPRAKAAALALCWPRLRRRLPAYDGRVGAYGGKVIDLICDPAKPDAANIVEVLVAGTEAAELVMTNLPHVPGAEGFNAPPEPGDSGGAK